MSLLQSRFGLRRLLLAAAAGLLLPAAVAQQAADGGYMVEVIVFTGGSGGTGEDLAAAGSGASGEDSAGGASHASRVLQTLPASRLKLGGVVSRLNAAGGYRTIAHAGWTQTAASWNSRIGTDVAEVGLSRNGLSGVVHLERGQYLHLGFNLTLAGPNGTWRINEVRRVRLGERQYFDHPAFGVIAVVSAPTP
jgi:hypothetical protein